MTGLAFCTLKVSHVNQPPAIQHSSSWAPLLLMIVTRWSAASLHRLQFDSNWIKITRANTVAALPQSLHVHVWCPGPSRSTLPRGKKMKQGGRKSRRWQPERSVWKREEDWEEKERRGIKGKGGGGGGIKWRAWERREVLGRMLWAEEDTYGTRKQKSDEENTRC